MARDEEVIIDVIATLDEIEAEVARRMKEASSLTEEEITALVSNVVKEIMRKKQEQEIEKLTISN